MFKIFNKKEKHQYLEEIYNKYNLVIKLKGASYERTFSTETSAIPDSYRQLLGWYHSRISDTYSFRYKDGILSFNRSNIEYINVFKSQHTRKI